MPAPKVVITLTTLPSRGASVLHCVRSLLAQEYENLAILLNVPEHCSRLAQPYQVSPELKRLALTDSRFCIRRVAVDSGPITKLLPTLATVTKGLVAVCDDDHCYGPRWLSYLVGWHLKCPEKRSVVGYSGLVRKPEPSLVKVIPKRGPIRVLCPQGYTGYLFDAAHTASKSLEQWFADICALAPDARAVDDVVIGAFFDSLAMPCFAVPAPALAGWTPLAQPDSLHEQDLVYRRKHGMGRHSAVVAALAESGMFAPISTNYGPREAAKP